MPHLNFQQLRKQNAYMSKTIQSYLQQIRKQKLINQQKEGQIQSLIKSNQRLLNIIENGMITNKDDNGSLVPISEKSQRESDIMNPLNFFIKTRKNVLNKGQKPNKSVIQTPSPHLQKFSQIDKHLQTPQLVISQHDQNFSLFPIPTNTITNTRMRKQVNDEKYNEITIKLETDISNEMKKMQQCAKKNKNFYDEKICQLKNLNEKIVKYRPEDKFKQIAQKIPMSAKTTDLVRKAMMSRKP